MLVKIVDNQKYKMVDELNHMIDASQQIKFAVAFAKKSGYLKIEDSLENFLSRKGKATILLGLDFHTTDPETLREINNLSEAGYSIELFCYRGNLEGTATYHPKLYIFHHEVDSASFIIGSSNLTSGGLVNNIEANVEITSTIHEELFSDVNDIFYQMKVSNNRIIPNDQYIEKYAEVYTLLRKGKDFSKIKAFIELQDIEQDLPKPKIEKTELVGWMKLVYEYIPDGQFSTKDIYKYEKVFKEKYPENQNVKAKIRQQLQFLRDFGLIKNPHRNVWIK